jgi:poly(hydroxyalkanoate) depolymerase family esterase
LNDLRYRSALAALRLTCAGDLVRAAAMLRRALKKRETAVVPAHGAPAGRFLPLSFAGPAGKRAYKLFIPSGYGQQACPLIVMLHGCMQAPDDFAAGTRMNVLADEFTCLVAYPEQPASANLLRCWNWFDRKDQQRDLGEPSLVAGITREIMRAYRIDRRRVYVAGISAGASAAAVLGATYPDVFAALGIHSGVACGLAHDALSGIKVMMTGEENGRAGRIEQPRARHRHVPTIVFQGDCDTTVNPRNAARFTAEIPPGLARRTKTGQVPGGLSYSWTTYNDAQGRGVLEQWTIHGEGHAWSGGSEAGSYTDSRGPDASWQFLRFFLAHRLTK